MANKIQIKRGLKSSLPVLNLAEPALCTDTSEVFIGGNSGNIQLTKQDDFASHLADNTKHIPYAVATGSANTYAVTLSPAPTAYVDGMAICVKINVASTGASTLNVNGLGAKTILDSLGNAITSGGLKAGVPYTLRYNGTNFIVQVKGWWKCDSR